MSDPYIDYTEQQYSLILEDTLESFGGQPGAGKTALIRYHEGNWYECNCGG